MFAQVIIEYSVKSLDRCFTYLIPSSLENKIKKGMKVKVPFGNQKIYGIVINITNQKPDYEIKEIIDIENEEFYLNEELLELGKFLQEETLCTLISAYQTMLPTSLKIDKDKNDYTKYDIYLKLCDDSKLVDNYINNNPRKVKQIDLINELKKEHILKKDIPFSIAKALLENNIVKEEKIAKYRINVSNKLENKLVLNEEQQKAYDNIANNLDSYNTYLIQGVTGSGKTEVYMQLIEKVIYNGKNVIVLVPEICLTTQTVQRFYNRFGNNVAIFHSGLSDGEKYDEYKKIFNNEVQIVVGTRSSIFVPFNNLGLVIIDEEHSDTYKQENNPRYNTIDVAKFRCNYHNIPLILGSATPSLESRARADKNVYNLIRLDKRVNNNLPDIEMVDMTKEKKLNSIFSQRLQLCIQKSLDNKEQVILLLNRRGYSTFITCSNCGYTYKCPNCNITLTYHKTSGNLRCHYCGYLKYQDDKCPECHEQSLNYLGTGTQKVEEELKKLFPSANIIRMDQDTTSKKGSYQRIIDDFGNGKYDILLGTQMISKGLDFPNVTLVGIINADTSLNIPDFRASEKTFSLLSQTSGRSGRSNKKGQVLIQTYNPDNAILNYVQTNDYDNFYLYEMNIRHQLLYPPYTYICLLNIKDASYEKISKIANEIKKDLSTNLDSKTIVLGPTPAPMFCVNKIYNFQIIIKYTKDHLLKDELLKIKSKYQATIDITFNPCHF